MEEVGFLRAIWSAHWAHLQERLVSVHKLKGDAEIPHKSLLFFIPNFWESPESSPEGPSSLTAMLLRKMFFFKVLSLILLVYQTTSFFVPNVLACWSHLFLLDCKSPSSLETHCVYLFSSRTQHVLAHLNISTFSELAWDKKMMARAGLSLSLCQLGGFCFAQLRSAVFAQI